MPIRRDLRHFYRGIAWRAVRDRIRARAGDKCEACGVPNHSPVIRMGGYWLDDEEVWRDPQGGITNAPPAGLRSRFVSIVCTTAHVNHTSGDDRDENLKFFCQWCHFNFDLAHHKETRSIRKDRTRPLLQSL